MVIAVIGTRAYGSNCDCNHYTITPGEIFLYRHQTQIEEENKTKLQKFEDYSQQLQASKVGGDSSVVIYIQNHHLCSLNWNLKLKQLSFSVNKKHNNSNPCQWYVVMDTVVLCVYFCNL